MRHDDLEVLVPAARQRALLAVLAVRAGQIVPSVELADILWDGAPPPGARSTVRGYVKRLRQVLGPGLACRVLTRDPGYLLDAKAGEVDLQVFNQLCAEGGAAIRAGAWLSASRQLGEALRLWRGEPLADVPSESLRAALLPRLEAQRLQALEWHAEAGLALGRHRELVAELTALATSYPLRERFCAQLMLALYRCDQQGEALAAYQQARRMLVSELGVEPGPVLQELHRRILAADPSLIPAAPPSGTPAAGVGAAAVGAGAAGFPGTADLVPRQLPAALPNFVGRAAELAALDELAGEGSASVVIAVLDGTAGVGKTALTVQWAHRMAGHFPDGQLYVNLRGFYPSGSPVTPEDAIRGFLDALQVPAQDIPNGLDGQAALYRSLVAGRRMLVVLDNARDAAQVRPLLPGSPGCFVLVNSRKKLTALVAAEDARMLTLDVLSEEEALELLSGRIGRGRVAAERAEISELAGLCARLPLALAIIAARATTRAGLPLASLAGELRQARLPLDNLNSGDAVTSVRAVFSWSYRELTDPAARVFRLLGVHPGPDISAAAAASLAGIPVSQVRDTLGELTGAHLLTEPAPDRFALHDLLRAYAAEQSLIGEGDADRHAAMRRVLDHYLHSARVAAIALSPYRPPVTMAAPQPGVTPEHPGSHDEALAWFEAEYLVLIAVIAAAAERRSDRHAWQLPWALADFLDRRGHWRDYAATQRTALAAARRLADDVAQAHAHHHLSQAHVALGSYQEAHRHLGQALALHRKLADHAGEAHAHLDISTVLAEQGHHRDAVRHDRQGLELYREAGDRHGQARALNSLGWDLAHLNGQRQQAVSCCQEAVQVLGELGDRYGQAAAYHSLGYTHQRLGNYAEAAASYQHTLELLDEADDAYRLACAYHQQIQTIVITRDANTKCDCHAMANSRIIIDKYFNYRIGSAAG